LEVEPILEVLIGKALEHAQIEIIEAHEAAELAKHKKVFL
jgi:Radial spoke protein 3